MHQYALFALVAVASASFSQEQVSIPAIAALTQGPPGVAVGAAATTTATTQVATATAVAPADQCAAQVAQALSSASAAAQLTVNATGAITAATTVAATAAATTAKAAATTAAAANADGSTSIAGADFGTCNPTIKFEGGLGGRPATEFTFQSQDPAIIAVQQEALNPNIITNRICDSLTNFCNANAAAKTVCLDAKAQILALGTTDVTTAQKWNELVGFAGVSINPDGGPAAPAAAAAPPRFRRYRV